MIYQSPLSNAQAMSSNIAINHRAFGTGLKTATRFFAGYGGRYK